MFVPSFSALECLLNICCVYTAESEIVFNCNKNVGVVYLPKMSKQPATLAVSLNVMLSLLNKSNILVYNFMPH